MTFRCWSRTGRRQENDPTADCRLVRTLPPTCLNAYGTLDGVHTGRVATLGSIHR